VKKLVALSVAALFALGTVGFAIAQAPAEKKAEEKKEKKAEAGEKRMAAKNVNGTVKSAGADSIVVAGKAKGKDAEWTFALTDKTKIKKGGKDATAKDLAGGDAVHVRYMEHEGKNVATQVTVRPAARKAETKAEAKPAEKPAEKK
jgi:hypothetical protein